MGNHMFNLGFYLTESLGSLFRSLNFVSRSVVVFVMLSIELSSSISQEREMKDTKWRLLPTVIIHCGLKIPLVQ